MRAKRRESESKHVTQLENYEGDEVGLRARDGEDERMRGRKREINRIR